MVSFWFLFTALLVTGNQHSSNQSFQLLDQETELSQHVLDISPEVAKMTDNTERNRAHFDEHASTYNNKWQKTIDQIILEIQARKDWIGVDWVEDDDSSSDQAKGSEKKEKRTVRLLDYACGTGLVSRALAPYITSSVGIDLSTSMVNEFNKGASNQGLSPSEMRAVVGNLVSISPSSDPELSKPEYFDFDIAVVGLGFHHFDEPALAAKRLTERLKKGGVLMIIDFLPHGKMDHSHSHSHQHDHGHSDSHSHGHSHKSGEGDVIPSKLLNSAIQTVAHQGFTIEDVRKMFEDAGAGEGFEYVAIGNAIVFSRSKEDGEEQSEEEKRDFKRSVFMARGMKA